MSAMWMWRLGVAVALAAASMRSGGLGHVLPNATWLFLQFGPLLALGLSQTVAWLWGRGWKTLSRRAQWVLAPAAAYLVLATASSGWAADAWQTLFQAGLLGTTTMFIASTYVHRWTARETLHSDLAVVYLVGVGVQAVGLAGYLVDAQWAVGDYHRLVGLTPNAIFPGIASAALVAMSFVFSSFGMRVVAVIPLVTLVLSDTRGAMIGLLGGLLVAFAVLPDLRRGTLRVSVLALVVAVPALYWMISPRSGVLSRGGSPGTGPSSEGAGDVPGLGAVDEVSSGRLGIWWEYLRAWADRPLLGAGYRSPSVQIGGELFEAHNVYLSVLFETGLLGAIIFGLLLVGVVRSARHRTPLVAAGATVLVVELTESSLFGLGGPVALTSWIILFAWAATGLDRSGEILLDLDDGGTAAVTGARRCSSSSS